MKLENLLVYGIAVAFIIIGVVAIDSKDFKGRMDVVHSQPIEGNGAIILGSISILSGCALAYLWKRSESRKEK